MPSRWLGDLNVAEGRQGLETLAFHYEKNGGLKTSATKKSIEKISV